MEMFNEFLGKEVKVPYKDGSQFKIARGVLIENKEGFVKIKVLLRNRGLSVRCCDSGVFHAHREITIISP